MADRIEKLGPFVGVNLDQDPSSVPKDALTLSRNLHPIKPGGDLILRKNSEVLIDNSGVLRDGGTMALFNYFDGTNSHLIGWLQGDDQLGARLICFDEQNDWVFDNIQYDDGLSGQPLVSEIGSHKKPAAVQWQNQLYLFTGGSVPGWRLDPRSNATSAPVIATPLSRIWTPGDMPRPTVAGTYRGTVAIAGFDSDPSLLRWLEVGDPSVLVSAAKAIYVGREYVDRITATFEVAVESGSAGLNSYFLVAKSSSMFIYTGNPPTTATDGDLSRSVILSEYEGCVAKETVARTPYGTVWCSGRNVWLAPRSGGKPFPIGETIRPLLEGKPQAPDLWCAAFHNGFYRLAIPSGVSDPSGIALTQTEQWWCDMRAFPKVSWWGPMEMATDTLCAQRLPNGNTRLFSGVCRHEDPSNIGASKFYLELHDQDTPDGLDHYAAQDDLPWTVPIPEILTKEFDWGDPHSDKLIEAVELAYFNAYPTYINVGMIKDGGTGVTTQTEYGLFHDGFKLDVSQLDGVATLPGDATFRTRTFNPPNGKRFLAKSVQVGVNMVPDGLNAGSRIKSMMLHVTFLNRRQAHRVAGVNYGDGGLGGGIDPV